MAGLFALSVRWQHGCAPSNRSARSSFCSYCCSAGIEFPVCSGLQVFPLLGTPLHVLVADDDQDIREMLRTALQLDGHHVLEAPDGRTAWELIVARRPALVVADVQMPGLDGLDLTALIKANGYHETKVIVFAGGMATEKEALIAGADAYVTKGAPLSELRAAVSRLCPVERESRPGRNSSLRAPKLEA